MYELICSTVKKSRRSTRRKTKKTADCDGFPLDKNGNKRCSQEYICMDAYAKTCLVKVNGEKLPEFPRNQFNKLNGNRKSRVNTVSNKPEAKSPNKDILRTKIKRDIIAENIAKQGKKLHVNPVKKISATNNFVYEFNLLTTNAKQMRPLMLQTHLWRTNNSDQTLSHLKTDTASLGKPATNHNEDLTKRKSSAILPELNSRVDYVTVDPDSNVTNSSPTKNTCLPILGKENPTKTLNKQVDKEYERNDIDHEVENVKSAWQMLREKKYWTKGQDRIGNARTKKVYELLEKMTREIDRSQNYVNPKGNLYLYRNATNALRTDGKPNLQEEDENVRSIIFPDRKEDRIKSAASHLRNVDSEIIGINKDIARVRFDEAVENTLIDKQPHKNLLLSKYTAKERSIHTDAHEHDIANNAKSVHTLALNTYNKKRDTAVADKVKPTFMDSKKMRAKIKSSIEEYLERYSNNIHKTHSIEEKECSRDVKPSASDIANILASYNIGSHVLNENFEKRSDSYDSDDYTSENNEDRFCSNTALNATQVMPIDTKQENKKIHDNTIFENIGLYNDTRLTKAIDARSFDIQRQSSITNCQDNAFIKMGLNKNLSRDTLSQILQSEYLRKDLSL